MTNKPEADEKFEAALKEYIEALDGAEGDENGYLVDWVMVTAHHIPHPDGSSGTAMAVYVSPRQALHRTGGLAMYLYQKIKLRMVNPNG
jgi:hypothetical protein